MVALLAFVISVSLVAVLLADGDSEGTSGSPIAVASQPPTPQVTPEATPVATSSPEPTATPALPGDLPARVNALPDKLRDQALQAYMSGRFSLEQLEQVVTDYENRNPNLRVGSVVSVTDNVLRFEVFTTGEQVEVTTVEGTLIMREGQALALQDLQPTELVMVVSADGGITAQTIEAFGVASPE